MKDTHAIALAAGLSIVLIALVASLDALFPAPALDLSSLRVNASLLESVASDAPVTLLVFTDYQCKPCRALHPTLLRLKQAYGDAIRIITYFIPGKGSDITIGIAAQCGNKEGYRNLLYQDPGRGDPERFVRYAEQLHQDASAFSACAADPETARAVQKGIALGLDLGVSRVPTLFMNGVRVDGAASFAELKLLIDSELK